MSKIRQPAVAGQFYPQDPKALTESIGHCMSAAESIVTSAPPGIVGCVVPHAGYMYSGPTAACTYRALMSLAPQTVVLVGPSHRDYFTSVSVYDGDGFATPLGVVPVDTRLARSIAEGSDSVVLGDIGHRMEHALEVQIPFLQATLPDIQIVPITMGMQDRNSCEVLASALVDAVKDSGAVLMASSDLSHFHPYDEALRIDQESERMISSFDAEEFLRALETEKIEACGGGPVVAVMMASRQLGAERARVLYSCNSGDVSGDRSSVVGYLSAVFDRPTA